MAAGASSLGDELIRYLYDLVREETPHATGLASPDDVGVMIWLVHRGASASVRLLVPDGWEADAAMFPAASPAVSEPQRCAYVNNLVIDTDVSAIGDVSNDIASMAVDVLPRQHRGALEQFRREPLTFLPTTIAWGETGAEWRVPGADMRPIRCRHKGNPQAVEDLGLVLQRHELCRLTDAVWMSVMFYPAVGADEVARSRIRDVPRDFVTRSFTRALRLAVPTGYVAGWWRTERDARSETLATGTGPKRPRGYSAIKGQSTAVITMLRLVDTCAKSSARVLIEGETGTGKELVARALHDHSPRRSGPFEAENCAAVPEPLLETELFGHVEGAFTGAVADRDGLFQRADGGTLFLDEVGEMSPQMQVRLLRVLEQREVRPVGGAKYVPVDVRVVAATHRNLQHMVEQGTFREDLYQRMKVLRIPVPPLRERADDIPVLAKHFLTTFAENAGRIPPVLADEALELLMAARWSGNVRELMNECERLVALVPGDVIQPENLSESIGEPSTQRRAFRRRREDGPSPTTPTDDRAPSLPGRVEERDFSTALDVLVRVRDLLVHSLPDGQPADRRRRAPAARDSSGREEALLLPGTEDRAPEAADKRAFGAQRKGKKRESWGREDYTVLLRFFDPSKELEPQYEGWGVGARTVQRWREAALADHPTLIAEFPRLSQRFLAKVRPNLALTGALDLADALGEFVSAMGAREGPGVNALRPHDAVRAYAMAARLAREQFDHILAIGPEGWVYAFFFYVLGVPVKGVCVDYPATLCEVASHLPDLATARILLIEDDVQSGATLQLVLERLGAADVELLLGHSLGVQKLKNVPAEIDRVWIAESDLSDADLCAARDELDALFTGIDFA